MAKKTDYMPILVIGALGALLYFMSKQKTDGDNGGGFQLPGLPDIGINIPTSFEIPTLPELDALQGCPGLTMPDLSHLLDLGLPDLNLPDLRLPELDLGLPGLDLRLPDLGGERKVWNPFGFLPDIRFELPDVSWPGLPPARRLNTVFSLLLSSLGPLVAIPLASWGVIRVFEPTSATEDVSESGDVSQTSSRTAITPFFIPGPVGAESAPVAKVVVPPVGGVGAPDRELPFVT